LRISLRIGLRKCAFAPGASGSPQVSLCTSGSTYLPRSACLSVSAIKPAYPFLQVSLLICFRKSACLSVSASQPAYLFLQVSLLIFFRKSACLSVSVSQPAYPFLQDILLNCYCKSACLSVSASQPAYLFPQLSLLIRFLKSTFDCCNHDILLSKLFKMGIKGKELLWFKNYLF
jgi:hypothetical protein